MDALWGKVASDVMAWREQNRLVNVAYDYPGIRHGAASTPPLSTILIANYPGRVKLPGKTLLVQGTADTSSYTSLVIKLDKEMLLKGNDISLALYDGADHFGVVMPALALMRAYWADLFGLRHARSDHI